jgi:hypothetical protein
MHCILPSEAHSGALLHAAQCEQHERDLRAEQPHPLFFISVASKRVSFFVSLLFATLAGRSISVAAKGVMGAGISSG